MGVVGVTDLLTIIPYIALAIVSVCVLIRFYNTLYYVRKACEKYLSRTTDQKQSDHRENASTKKVNL